MTKEYLEAWKRLNTDDSDYALKRAVKDVDIVDKALTRLEAIDNANPSETLECLERLKYYHERSMNDLGCKEHRLKDINTIKQALLKAQEPKHYLKWEDLEFTSEDQTIKIKMGDTVYKILYRCCDGIKEVQLLSEDEKLLFLNLIGKYKDNIQFFNDLHLERVEE